MDLEPGKRAAAARAEAQAPARHAGDDSGLHRYQIACRDLRAGMFVAELDRPWLDTPFLIQGFVITKAAEIEALSRHCRHVFVDLDKSDRTVVDAIRKAEIKRLPIEAGRHARLPFTTNPEAGPKTPQHARKVSSEGRVRLRRFLTVIDPSSLLEPVGGGLLGRIGAWLRGLFEPREDPARLAAEAKKRTHELRRTLPPGVKLRRYADRSTVEQELPRAREAFDRSEDALRKVVSDVKAGRLPDLQQAEAVIEDIVESMIENPDALMWVARMRDEDANTFGHAIKVALYMVAMGRHIGFPKNQLGYLAMIGLLADVGKTKLPRSVLDKPGMLSAQEYTLVKEHVRLGMEALQKDAPLPDVVVQGISQHHERLDGSGYPRGLKGSEIGIFGRMAAIADTYAALITPRVYANPVSPHDAMLNLFEWAGTSFHEPLVEQFVQAVGVFPVGSMVELSSQEIAIVLAHNKVRRLEPRVLVLTWPDKSPLATPIERNLFDKPKGADGKPIRILRSVPAGSFGIKVKDFYGAQMASANSLI